jgi:NADH:ubiquinone oxidoreductase subunit E
MMEDEVEKLDLPQLVDHVVKEHGATPDAIIPILSQINRALGYIPAAALPEIRRHIQIPAEGVFLAATW